LGLKGLVVVIVVVVVCFLSESLADAINSFQNATAKSESLADAPW
jgi:hypothetical protein